MDPSQKVLRDFAGGLPLGFHLTRARKAAQVDPSQKALRDFAYGLPFGFRLTHARKAAQDIMITASLPMPSVFLATSNPGKLREFREAATNVSLDLELFPNLNTLPPAIEDGSTFEQNARIKAEYYSRFAPGELILAEDSGLAVEQLGGAPGVHSARYASVLGTAANPPLVHVNSDDEDNNRALVSQLERLPAGKIAGKYVCVIAVARKSETLATFLGEAPGELLTRPRGGGGFGYDPLFYFSALGKTFAELSLEEKRQHSHRGKAFHKFLKWYAAVSR